MNLQNGEMHVLLKAQTDILVRIPATTGSRWAVHDENHELKNGST